MAPVPEEVKINTSFFVWKRYFNPSLTSANNFSNSGSRWCMMGSAILRSTSGGSIVGPGENRYFLSMKSSYDNPAHPKIRREGMVKIPMNHSLIRLKPINIIL
jgi:hypothetical protein